MSEIQNRIDALFEELADAALAWDDDAELDDDAEEGWQADWAILAAADSMAADSERLDIGEKALTLLAEIAGRL